MPSTYVNNLRLTEMATGEETNNWGNVTNTNLELVGEALGYGTENLASDADATITIADGAADAARSLYLRITSTTLTATRTVTLAPNTVSKVWMIENATTGGQSITVKQGTGATVTIANGKTVVVYTDGAGAGAKVVDANATLQVSSLDVNGVDGLPFTVRGTSSTASLAMGMTSTSAIIQAQTSSAESTAMVFKTAPSSGTETEAMRITSGQEVVIGATAATSSALLTISGVGSTTGSIDPTLAVVSTGTGVSDDSIIMARIGGTSANSYIMFGDSGDANAGEIRYAHTGDTMRFTTAAAERMRIGSDGMLMLGGSTSSYDTTPPVAGLSLYYESDTGTATIGSYSSGGTTQLIFSTNTGGGANAERLRIEGAGTIWTPTVSGASNNLRLGYLAGQDLASGGNYNTMVGDSAGTDVTTGDYNTLLGYGAGYAYTTQGSNTMVGNSGVNNTGSYNTGVGHQTIYAAGAGSYLTALGTYALYANTTGDYSVAVGYGALDSNTEGDKNVAVGYNALTANTTADDNTAVGNSAAGSNTTGLGNVAVGHSALYANVLGHYSTVVGTYALDAQAPTGSTSMYNCAFGAFAGTNLTTGLQNTFVGGYSAGTGTVTGHSNTAVGYIAGNDISSGAQNTFLGSHAGYENAGASYNTFLGAYSGYSTDTGTHNTVVGRYAAYSMTSGHNNVVIGENACSNTANEELTTAGYCVAIGNNVNLGSATADYQVVIGTTGTVGKGASTAFLNANSGAAYQGDNNASWTTTSDRRIKKNISDNDVGLDAINQIRVRNYEYRKPEEITDLPSHLAVEKEGVQVGVVAQEIREVLPNVVKEEEETGFLSVSNDDVTWHLVNAVKELSAKVKELEEKLNG